MRSTIWTPGKDPTKHGFKLGFEGGLHPVIAELMMALQLHQGKVTPEMVAQLQSMTESLKKATRKAG
jgi:hypothetical protein